MIKHAPISLALKLSSAAALLLAPSAALAEDDAGKNGAQFQLAERTFSSAKSDAILGQGSALAALLGKQGVAVREAPARLPAPASYAAYDRPTPYVQRAAIDRRAHPSRPDLFGTVALEVGKTPFDQRWAAVERRPVYGAAARYARGLRGMNEATILDRVNRYVNGRVAFTEDRAQFGRADRWLSAGETFSRGRGDCEDYAIAKMQMLRAAGFASDDLYLVVLKDLVRRADHAVLAVRSGGRFQVLDNGTDRIVDAADIADYRPILTYSAGKAWTHGYQRYDRPDFPPVNIASYMPALQDGQRVALADIMPVRPAANR
ncbi:transglutaminase-like cysteine peptidase [Sphingomicrobium clamense]|uniref:Transglutaminase-like cysteine peptidase n=1 Tax=Sphingomicrobium clamense TaxID=2851013 RepID=A0ABS6V8F4_9SPHN|nr:transglutaminase-like cysteine peptidase [Sphingomicrobium sp. B8]MBW0145859.1 transglutaminase-like cysteine peptidase [Sphingomicrobium sp. B8]